MNNFLRESAIAQVISSTTVSTSSVTVYRDLRKFVEKVAYACAHVEDGSGQQKLHVVEFLEKVRDRAWADIKGALST